MRRLPEDYNGVERQGARVHVTAVLHARDFMVLEKRALNTCRNPVGMASWLVRRGLGVAPMEATLAPGLPSLEGLPGSPDPATVCGVLCNAIMNEIDSIKGSPDVPGSAGDLEVLNALLDRVGPVLHRHAEGGE